MSREREWWVDADGVHVSRVMTAEADVMDRTLPVGEVIPVPLPRSDWDANQFYLYIHGRDFKRFMVGRRDAEASVRVGWEMVFSMYDRGRGGWHEDWRTKHMMRVIYPKNFEGRRMVGEHISVVIPGLECPPEVNFLNVRGELEVNGRVERLLCLFQTSMSSRIYLRYLSGLDTATDHAMQAIYWLRGFLQAKHERRGMWGYG